MNEPRRPRVADEPAIVHPNGDVTIRAPLVGAAAGAIDAYAELERRTNGRSVLSPTVAYVRDALRLGAQVAISGPADVRKLPPQARSHQTAYTEGELMTAKQIGIELGCSTRHASRLAKVGAFGTSFLRGGARVAPRAEVLAFKACRDEGGEA